MSHETHSVAATADSWSIDLHLRHTSTDELAAARQFLLELPATRAVSGVGSTGYATVRLQSGNKISKYDTALRDLASFLRSHAPRLRAFKASGGDIELVLNHTTITPEQANDKTLDLWLAPELLKDLSVNGIALRVIGWAEEKDSE